MAGIAVPALRERLEDIPLLVDHFLARYGPETGIESPSITRDAIDFLQRQPWPGNIRQLQNILRKALVRCQGFAIDVADLEELLGPAEGQSDRSSLRETARELLRRAAEGEIEAAYPAMIRQLEEVLLSEAIRMTKGNQAKAARWLGISRLTLRERLREFELHPKGK